jgi:signal transduction histidine kinase
MQWPSYARNSVPPNLSPTWAVGVGIIRVLAAGLVLLVADRTFLRNRAVRPARLWVVIATWIAAGMAAMAMQSAALLYLDAGGITPLRWVVSSATFALRSALCAYYFGLRDHWSRSVVELEAAADRLSGLRAISRASLADIRARVRSIIVDQVLPSIRQLQGDLSSQGASLSSERLLQLSRIAETYAQGIVREASHQVSDLTHPGTTLGQDARAGLRAPARRTRGQPLLVSVRWSALVLLVTIAPTALTAPPDDPGLPILIAIGFVIALLGLGAWIQSRLAGRARSRTTAWSLCWMTGTAAISVVVATVAGVLPARLSSPLPMLTLFGILFILALLASSIDRHLRGIRGYADELASVLAEITMINDALQEDIAAEKRRVALLLHGPVQGRLAAVALMLRLEAGQDSRSNPHTQVQERCLAILDQVVVDLTRVLGGTFDDGRPLDERLVEFAQRWRGLVTVSIALEPAVMYAIRDDPGLGMWVFDIVEEGINNAVTHGHATEVDVTISLKPGRIEVVVCDDGNGRIEGSSPGLGLATIGRSPARWTLTSGPHGGALLTVRVPLEG